MRPRFLDQPFFHQRTPRTNQSPADYASPVVIHTRTRWHAADYLRWAGLLGSVAFLGLLLAWRG